MTGASEPPPSQRRRWHDPWRRHPGLFASLLFHALLLWFLAGWVVFPGVPPKEEPVFIQVAVPESAADAGAPASASDLPVPAAPVAAAPAIPVFTSPRGQPMPLPAPAPAHLGGAAGTGGARESSGVGTAGNGLSLFGLSGDARRVVVAVDVSGSMFARSTGAFARIAEAACAALDRLDGRTEFDLLVFEDGSLAWRPALVPATEPNRRDARRWLETIGRLGTRFSARGGRGTVLFEGGGTRGDTALRQAFSLAPDWLIVLTDGEWNAVEVSGVVHHFDAAEIAALAASLQRARGGSPLRIDVVFLVTAKTRPAESEAARTLAEANGGRLVEVRADALP